MSAPLLSDERIDALAMELGDDTRLLCAAIMRETADACARIAEEIGRTRLAEFHDTWRMAEGIAAEIRRRMGE